MNVGPVRKAVVAGLVAAAGAFGVATADGKVTLAEVGVIVGAAVAAAAAVYRVPNKAA